MLNVVNSKYRQPKQTPRNNDKASTIGENRSNFIGRTIAFSRTTLGENVEARREVRALLPVCFRSLLAFLSRSTTGYVSDMSMTYNTAINPPWYFDQ